MKLYIVAIPDSAWEVKDIRVFADKRQAMQFVESYNQDREVFLWIDTIDTNDYERD